MALPVNGFYAHGKLLLTGEYFVLDGATALALPTRQGQRLDVMPTTAEGKQLAWTSYDADGTSWFDAVFSAANFEILHASNQIVADTLRQLLRAARQLNPAFLALPSGWQVSTRLEFPRLWGLGSSSTLVWNLANWAGVDAYQLLERTFGGSGYDLACAGVEGAIVFQRKQGEPTFHRVDFSPPFREKLFFVYLGRKQNSRAGIARYREQVLEESKLIRHVSQLTEAIVRAGSLSIFEKLLTEHEALVSTALDLPTAKSLYFNDFEGAVKSLGAWGGDFVLVTNPFDTAGELIKYLSSREFTTAVAYGAMVL
jgi:mevalonate kinase